MPIQFHEHCQAVAEISKDTLLNVHCKDLLVSASSFLRPDQPAVLVWNGAFIQLIIFESREATKEWLESIVDIGAYSNAVGCKFHWFNMEDPSNAKE